MPASLEPLAQRQSVLTYPVDIVGMDQACQIIESAWRDNRCLHVVTLNAEMVVASQKDPEMDRIIRKADLIVPDGAGVVWALRLAHSKNASVARLPGIELADRALQAAAANNVPVALLGGRPEVMAKLVETLPAKYPGLNICASHHGFFKGEDNAIVDQIAQTKPKLLLVALGVPRQEYFIDRFADKFPNTVLIGVGGSFDVWTGFVKRAPETFQKLHLEWLYRLLKEPWRFNRMAGSLPNFACQALLEVMAKRLGLGKNKSG